MALRRGASVRMLLALLVAASSACASELVSTIRDSPPFPTVEDAVRAALARALGMSRKYELGGAIFAWRGSYYFTEPVSNGSRELSTYHAEAPADAQIVAIYHTHPAHDMDEFFSAADIATSKRLGVR